MCSPNGAQRNPGNNAVAYRFRPSWNYLKSTPNNPLCHRETTAGMHDSMDGGGRAASGTAAEYVARMKRSAIRESTSRPGMFPAFRCAACGLRVSHFMTQASYSRSKEALNKLQKRICSLSLKGEGWGEGETDQCIDLPLSLALSPFQGERGLVQSFLNARINGLSEFHFVIGSEPISLSGSRPTAGARWVVGRACATAQDQT